jgi:hypothetical protein
MKIKGLLTVAMLVGFFAAPAQAVTVYSYETTGCFVSCNVATNFGTTAVNPGQPGRNGMEFSGFTANSVTGPDITLGTFTLDANKDVRPVSSAFQLQVPFTDPGIAGSTFSAMISGQLNPGNGNGDVVIDFGSALQINFAGGSFFLQIDPVSLNKDDLSDPIVGHISGLASGLAASPVPGPIVGAGLPGILMALGGLIAWRRRRMAAA